MPGKVHADDTPVNVLEPGQGKTRTGRLWVYVRDDRHAGSTMPATVWFSYSPDRKGIHPQQHLAGITLQADAYAGYNALYENGRVMLPILAPIDGLFDDGHTVFHVLGREASLSDSARHRD